MLSLMNAFKQEKNEIGTPFPGSFTFLCIHILGLNRILS